MTQRIRRHIGERGLRHLHDFPLSGIALGVNLDVDRDRLAAIGELRNL